MAFLQRNVTVFPRWIAAHPQVVGRCLRDEGPGEEGEWPCGPLALLRAADTARLAVQLQHISYGMLDTARLTVQLQRSMQWPGSGQCNGHERCNGHATTIHVSQARVYRHEGAKAAHANSSMPDVYTQAHLTLAALAVLLEPASALPRPLSAVRPVPAQ